MSGERLFTVRAILNSEFVAKEAAKSSPARITSINGRLKTSSFDKLINTII